MTKHAVEWNFMAKQLWEEQVKEQLMEIREIACHRPAVEWSEIVNQLASQFSKGRENISTTVLTPKSKEQIWAEAANKLWQEQVREQLIELREFGLDATE